MDDGTFMKSEIFKHYEYHDSGEMEENDEISD